jgi:hypothetical protein
VRRADEWCIISAWSRARAYLNSLTGVKIKLKNALASPPNKEPAIAGMIILRSISLSIDQHLQDRGKGKP